MDLKNTPGIATADGSLTMHDTKFGESFHSDMGALREAEDLYIAQSGLIHRLSRQSSVTVLDVGLGLGYNAIATIAAWQMLSRPCQLRIISLERQHLLAELLASCQGNWLHGWTKDWLRIGQQLKRTLNNPNSPTVSWQHPTHSVCVAWTLHLGDAREWIKNGVEHNIDIVFQDPFSPQKNPSMWSEEWFARLRSRVKNDGTLVSYSVASKVRKHMTLSGWAYEKIPTTGIKKHWLRGWPTMQIPTGMG